MSKPQWSNTTVLFLMTLFMVGDEGIEGDGRAMTSWWSCDIDELMMATMCCGVGIKAERRVAMEGMGDRRGEKRKLL